MTETSDKQWPTTRQHSYFIGALTQMITAAVEYHVGTGAIKKDESANRRALYAARAKLRKLAAEYWLNAPPEEQVEPAKEL